MFFAHASKTTTFHKKFMKNVADSHIHKLRERLESCSFAKQNTYCINQFIYYKKWVNRPLILILSESSQFFCANRPVRFFARIVPVESSQGGTGFCAKRPVTSFCPRFLAKILCGSSWRLSSQLIPKSTRTQVNSYPFWSTSTYFLVNLYGPSQLVPILVNSYPVWFTRTHFG